MTLSDYHTVTEAAERLNIHPESVRRLIHSGELPATKVFDVWVIRNRDLARYMTRQRVARNEVATQSL